MIEGKREWKKEWRKKERKSENRKKEWIEEKREGWRNFSHQWMSSQPGVTSFTFHVYRQPAEFYKIHHMRYIIITMCIISRATKADIVVERCLNTASTKSRKSFMYKNAELWTTCGEFAHSARARGFYFFPFVTSLKV